MNGNESESPGNRLGKIDARQAFAGSACRRSRGTLCHDYYYKAHPELTLTRSVRLNYDHPQAFD